MTKTRLAAVIAAMFAVPAGVVATGQSASSPESAEMSAPVQSAATVEPVTVAEFPTERAIGIAPVQPAIQVEYSVRTIRLDSIPHQEEPGSALLPRQLAYLDGMQAQRSNLIAQGDAFPASHSPDDAAPLPAQLAYFDRLEQTRIAGLQSSQVASVDGSSTPAESSTPGAIALADASPAR